MGAAEGRICGGMPLGPELGWGDYVDGCDELDLEATDRGWLLVFVVDRAGRRKTLAMPTGAVRDGWPSLAPADLVTPEQARGA